MLSNKTKRELKIDQRQILIDSIEIGIPSTQQILTWGERTLPNGKRVGLIKNSKTVNYKRFTPFRDGLFCERIFGPVTSFVCACGKKQPHNKVTFCEKCEVEYIDQRSRRYRLGYISLLSPVTHIWYLKGRPSYLSLFLGKRKKNIVALAYCNSYLIEHNISKKSNSIKTVDPWSSMRSISNTNTFLQGTEKRSSTLSTYTSNTFVEGQRKTISSCSLPFCRTPLDFATAYVHSEQCTGCKSSLVFAKAKQIKAARQNKSKTKICSPCRAPACSCFASQNKRARQLSSFCFAKERGKGKEGHGLRCVANLFWFSPKRKNAHSLIFSICRANSLARTCPYGARTARKERTSFCFRDLLAPALVLRSKIKGHASSCPFANRRFARARKATQRNACRAPAGQVGAKQVLVKDFQKEGHGSKICIHGMPKIVNRSRDCKKEKTTFFGTFFTDSIKKKEVALSTSYRSYFYVRQHTLPFLPTLTSHFYLRDALLHFIYSSPVYEDIPIMEYCRNKRWEPLRDVHTFMAHKTVENDLGNWNRSFTKNLYKGKASLKGVRSYKTSLTQSPFSTNKKEQKHCNFYSSLSVRCMANLLNPTGRSSANLLSVAGANPRYARFCSAKRMCFVSSLRENLLRKSLSSLCVPRTCFYGAGTASKSRKPKDVRCKSSVQILATRDFAPQNEDLQSNACPYGAKQRNANGKTRRAKARKTCADIKQKKVQILNLKINETQNEEKQKSLFFPSFKLTGDRLMRLSKKPRYLTLPGKASSLSSEAKERKGGLLSGLELTAIREILSYTGGGALQQLLQQLDQHDLCKFLFAEAQILRVLYETHLAHFSNEFVDKHPRTAKEIRKNKAWLSKTKFSETFSRDFLRIKTEKKIVLTKRYRDFFRNPVGLKRSLIYSPIQIFCTGQRTSKVKKESESVNTGKKIDFLRNQPQNLRHAAYRALLRKDLLCAVPLFYSVKSETIKTKIKDRLLATRDFAPQIKWTTTNFGRAKPLRFFHNVKREASRFNLENSFKQKIFKSNKSKKNETIYLTPDALQTKVNDIRRKQLLRISRRIYKVARRLKVTQLLTRNHRRPEWMILSHLPVLPPELRPILQMSEKVIVASDLNIMYQRVIYRNNRHLRVRFIDFHLVTAIQRLVQDAVDRLIENGKGGSKPYYTQSGRPLKSLSDILKGKKGRFRLNLLGKRVDFSGRSVIVVSPSCKIHECGLPKEIALELYHYFLLRQLILKKHCASIVTAKKMIKSKASLMWDILRELMYHHPVLLNRAPTLHRLGIQAFQPKLVLGNAILLHPLVCSGFNADFDGDQMGVHLPLSFAARAESWDLLWSRNNLLSPATGQPMLVPSQDMVLGFYYITAPPLQSFNTSAHDKLTVKNERKTVQLKESGLYPLQTKQLKIYKKRKTFLFLSTQEVTTAFQNNSIKLHHPVWLQWNGKIENEDTSQIPLELRVHGFGVQQDVYEKHIRSTFFRKEKSRGKDFTSMPIISPSRVETRRVPVPLVQLLSPTIRYSDFYGSFFSICPKEQACYVRTTAGRITMNNLLDN